MSTIADSIWRIVKPRLDGEALKPAKNSEKIEAQVGVGTDTASRSLVESSRISVVTRIESDTDPDTYIDISQPVQVTFQDSDGKNTVLHMNPP